MDSFPLPSSPTTSAYTSDAMVAHSPRNLQDHLYASFLEGSTSDVALHISGSWHAVYRLHRVVLIQAEFFRRLFTAGFSESRFRQSPSCCGPEPIQIHFPDPNITRPAFEICISRLYGGGPQLHLPSTLIPTPLYPLTRSFPNYAELEATPPGHHPLTPRLLLSLLATAIYLSIPSVAGKSLTHILTTVGPTTAIRYLNFAIGKGIGPEEENAPEAAVGLERLAEIADPDVVDVASVSSKLSSLPIEDDETRKEDPAAAVYDEDCEEEYTDERHFIYGGISDKVGEAAACWLTRWGCDMLTYEEEESSSPGFISGSSLGKRSYSAFPAVLSAQARQPTPLIWRRGGLDARWARAILSSDLLFVRGERERYEMAKAVLELRRLDGIDEEEEKEFVELFENGIHFMHMSTEDLMHISTSDVSQTTGRPYVSTNRLHSSHWKQSELRIKIGTAIRDKELGITRSTTEVAVPSDVAFPPPMPYWVVASDSSERIGDGTGLENATMDQLFTGLPHDDNKKAIPANTSEANFFGILPPLQNAATVAQFDPGSKRRWSPFPPIRFAVEFWDVDCLKEKTRMHSHTVWYAGSLYNAYVQVIRKKGVQLGVYLHRQSHIDPLPPFSVPSPRRSEPSRISSFRPHSNSFSTATQFSDAYKIPTPASASTLTLGGIRSTTPVSAQPGSSTSSTPPLGNRTASPVNHPTQPYRDPRSAISAYFSISCASATGASVTRFSSGPDTFAISQSWGWKSSTLRTEEFLELGDDGQPIPIGLVDACAGKLVSLRATIVIGVI